MEERAANILLGISGPGTGFTIRWCGIRFRLKIKLISTERLIKISREISKIGDINEDDGTMFQALMKHAADSKHICRAIAIATGTKFEKIVAHAILKLPLRDVQTLFHLVVSQSDPERFFFTIISARKTSLMKVKQDV